MRIRESKISNKKVIQIFLSKEEENDKDIKNKIQEIETRNENIVLFISGNMEIDVILQEMIRIIKNESINF